MTLALSQFLTILSVWVAPVLLAITLHETAHAYAARRLGDGTGPQGDRVSLNPLRRIDPVGTVLLPAVLLFSAAPFVFGWGKPVPVDVGNLRRPRRDAVLVALAGPAANLLLATGAALLFHLLPLLPQDAAQWVGRNLRNAIHVNLVLVILNLAPIPPLDGGRVAVALLPGILSRPIARLRPYGHLIVVVIVFLLPMIGGIIDVDLGAAHGFIATPLNALMPIFSALAGLP